MWEENLSRRVAWDGQFNLGMWQWEVYFPIPHQLAWRKHILHQEVPSELSTGPVPYIVAPTWQDQQWRKPPRLLSTSASSTRVVRLLQLVHRWRGYVCGIEDIWEIPLPPSQSCSHHLPGTLKSRRGDTPMQVSSLWLLVSATIMSWAAPPKYKFRCTSQKR